jgi:hypothetical protein
MYFKLIMFFVLPGIVQGWGGNVSRYFNAAQCELVQGPQTVERYNGYRAAVVNGAAKPGFSSGQAAWRDGAPAGGDPAGGL